MNKVYSDAWMRRKVGRPRIHKDLVDKWREHRDDGWTYLAIALYYDVACMTVRRHLKGYYDDKEKVLKDKA